MTDKPSLRPCPEGTTASQHGRNTLNTLLRNPHLSNPDVYLRAVTADALHRIADALRERDEANSPWANR